MTEKAKQNNAKNSNAGAPSGGGWRDRQADVLRDNLKKRKMMQKARRQEAVVTAVKKDQ